MTIEEFLAAEAYFEPAAVALLKKRGFKVASPFARVLEVNTDGDPIIAPTPDDACTVMFHLGAADPTIRVFITTQRGGLRDMAGAFEGTLEITHRVPINPPGNLPPDEPGDTPGCYPRLLRQRGAIRATFLEAEDPFAEQLPMIDIESINIIEPERGIDREVSVNHATERFRIRFMPAQGAFA